MELVTELWPILAMIPAIIIKLTNDLKSISFFRNIIFIVPYLIGITMMVWLYFVFPSQWIGVYITNWIILAFWAVSWYEFTKNKDNQKEQWEIDLTSTKFEAYDTSE